MKITICHDCGLTMTSGVSVCRRCNQKRVRNVEIAASDDWVVYKRMDQLNPHGGNPYTKPRIAAILLVTVTAIGGIAYELNAHPGAYVARTTKSAIASTQSAIASLAPKSKSADHKLTASSTKKTAKSKSM